MFYSTMLPEKIVTKLKEKKVYREDDQIIAFYDDTMFLTGNKGIVCFKDRIVSYASQELTNVKLSEIESVEFREINKEKYLYRMIIRKKNIEEIDVTPGSIPNDEMKLLIDVINNFISQKR